MDHLQLRQPDNPIKLLHRRGVSLGRADVVARREHVAGVQADDQALRLLNTVQDTRDLLEPAPQIRPLPRRRLDGDPHFRPPPSPDE